MTKLFSTAVSSLTDRTQRQVQFTLTALAGMSISVFLLRIPTIFHGIAVLMLFLAIFSSPILSISDSLIVRIAQPKKLNYGGMRL
jgi:hypothetical protein